MGYCIIIRGPAGVGKTTVAKHLAKQLNADYFSYDKVMAENKLDNIVGDGIPTENFIKANEIISSLMTNDKNVILDGCFYREKQIKHLQEKLKTKIDIFTLHADIAECIRRNQTRKKPLTEDNVVQVYNLVNKLKIGNSINTLEKSIKQIVSEIIIHINK